MSRQHTSNRGSPQKHKGMKTSLFNNQQAHRQQTTIYTRPQKIFVQTVAEQPNVMPYIDSQYTNQPYITSEVHSEYVPVIERQNNFVRDTRQGNVQNVIRVSPLQGSNVATNLSRTKVQYVDHHQNRFQSAGSTFVPPPPQSFLINNQKLPQHRSPSMGKTVITVTPPHIQPATFQSVKKTYIPHHIINQIPVYGNASIYTESAEHEKGSSGGSGNDESQEVLMGYYEKLYAKFQAQQQQNQAIKQQLTDALNQINLLQSQQPQYKPTVIHQTIIQPQKKKVVDRQLLHELLSQKWNRTVDQVIERRKQACISQVGKMVESCKVTIRIPGEIVEQQVSEVYYRG